MQKVAKTTSRTNSGKRLLFEAKPVVRTSTINLVAKMNCNKKNDLIQIRNLVGGDGHNPEGLRLLVEDPERVATDLCSRGLAGVALANEVDAGATGTHDELEAVGPLLVPEDLDAGIGALPPGIVSRGKVADDRGDAIGGLRQTLHLHAHSLVPLLLLLLRVASAIGGFRHGRTTKVSSALRGRITRVLKEAKSFN